MNNYIGIKCIDNNEIIWNAHEIGDEDKVFRYYDCGKCARGKIRYIKRYKRLNKINCEVCFSKLEIE